MKEKRRIKKVLWQTRALVISNEMRVIGSRKIKGRCWERRSGDIKTGKEGRDWKKLKKKERKCSTGTCDTEFSRRNQVEVQRMKEDMGCL